MIRLVGRSSREKARKAGTQGTKGSGDMLVLGKTTATDVDADDQVLQFTLMAR